VTTIYLDNTATSWPKPPAVAEAMVRFLADIGANPGRSGHRRSIEAARIVYDAREALASLVDAPDPLRVIFTHNATEALNLALYGLLKPGDRVVTSGMEHNSVMRPLRDLEAKGVALTIVPCAPDGTLDPADLDAAVTPGTRMIVLTHASNVTGTLLPVAQAGAIARRRDALLLVDAAQTAGVYPIDVEADAIDLLAVTGHKALYGPTGTGALVIGERIDARRMEPLRRGGTGSRSEHQVQPDTLPDRFESGSLNAVGIAGLLGALTWIRERRVLAIREHELGLLGRLLAGLERLPGVTVFGPRELERRLATVSFAIAGHDQAAVGHRLDAEFGILCRVGLHCSPAAHRTIGTFPAGALRFGLGAFNTARDIDAALAALDAIIREGPR